jgi:EAL domain-containing protein (putative c-di-GMP-specific phosphodiesterase class I)
MLQGKLNHIKNPLGIYMRNLILKYTPVVNMRTKKIWGYDAVREVKKALDILS